MHVNVVAKNTITEMIKAINASIYLLKVCLNLLRPIIYAVIMVHVCANEYILRLFVVANLLVRSHNVCSTFHLQ